jgi:hypothetical protein
MVAEALEQLLCETCIAKVALAHFGDSPQYDLPEAPVGDGYCAPPRRNGLCAPVPSRCRMVLRATARHSGLSTCARENPLREILFEILFREICLERYSRND